MKLYTWAVCKLMMVFKKNMNSGGCNNHEISQHSLSTCCLLSRLPLRGLHTQARSHTSGPRPQGVSWPRSHGQGGFRCHLGDLEIGHNLLCWMKGPGSLCW